MASVHRRRWWIAGTVAVVVAALIVTVLNLTGAYRIQILMPTANGVVEGDQVMISGRPSGSVESVELHDNRDALVTVKLDSDVAPLHQGTNARVAWLTLLNARALEVLPGPKNAPPLPSGARVVSNHERVELDQVLAALDPQTMKNVNGLVEQLHAMTDGREKQLGDTIATAGPAVEAAGQITKAVGTDGPAIHDLVTQLHGVTSTLVQRKGQLGGAIKNLGPLTDSVAQQQQQLSQTVNQLPATLDQASTTLGKVPDAVDQTNPLLRDLGPATAQLPETARNLAPLLTDLRPVVQQLGPTLHSANSVLGETPHLLDRAHAAVPPATNAVQRLQAPVAFLRPYIPEGVGWLSNWDGVFASQTQTGGNYARALITTGGGAATDNPGVVPPGTKLDPRPAPGAIVNQPWTDANGDGPR